MRRETVVLLSNSVLCDFQVQFERETADVMRKLQEARRDEVKALAKKHRDRDELVRVKKEVAKGVVEKGVAERVKLAQNYELRREELQKQHESVRLALGEHRNKVSRWHRTAKWSIKWSCVCRQRQRCARNLRRG